MKSLIAANRSLLSDRIFLIATYTIVTLFSMICLIPFIIVIVNSITPEETIRLHGYQLIPTGFSLDAYQFLLSGKQVFRSYGITILVTLVGTILAVCITSMFAYVLSHQKVKYRNVLSFLTYFSMLMGTGLVGFYILMANYLGLKDSIWALILPYLLNPFYTFIFVSYYRSLPYEINEAATVDGANDMVIFFRIIWPISLPAAATVSLFYALQYWNDWWLALLFIDDYRLHPLQIMIRQLISNIDAQLYIRGGGSYGVVVPSIGIRFAMVCITIGPIILLYPFLQKYYIRGLTIGALKG